jgi:hypothetical protein
VRPALSFLALLLVAGALGNSDVPTVPGRFIEQKPVIDGIIGDEEWSIAGSFQGLVDSQTGEAAPEPATFWIAYDDKFIYFAARMFDSVPGQIQASEYRTNVSLRGDDTVTLRVDPFGNLTDFNSFSMNARGATNLEIAGGRAAKREWLGDFLAQGRITDQGWEVEARIPWSVMRLPAQGTRDVRFNVERNHRRLQRSYVHSFTRGGRVELTPMMLGVRIPPPERGHWQLLPYVYAGHDQRTGLVLNSGVDFRRSLTDQLDLVGSVNPDFRNIENQVLSLDFSYFERLAAESRPFFLEGAQFFRTSMEAPIFASQRIQGFDAGVKAFGKIDDQTDIGIMDTIDFGNENAAVARIQHRLSPRRSLNVAYAGLKRQGLSNEALFASYFSGSGPYTSYFQVSGTQDTERGNGHRMNGGIFFRGDKGVNWSLDYVEIDDDFLPRVGFAPERDLRGLTGRFEYLRPSGRGSVMEYGYTLSGGYFRTMEGKPYRERVGLSTTTTFVDGTDLDFDIRQERFRGFNDQTFGFDVERPRGDPYRRARFGFVTGTRGGMPYRSLSGGFGYRPVNTLQLSLSYQQVLRLGKTVDQIIGGFSYDLGRDQSVSGRYVQSEGTSNYYVAFRQSGNKGVEYFMILGDPSADRFTRNLVIKAVFPFQL